MHSFAISAVQRTPRPVINPAPRGEKSAQSFSALIVDDEDLIRWSLARGLRQRGHVVAEAPDAASALELIAGRPVPFDVVLLDFRMPDRQDLTLLEDIRRLSPESAVFMMTAFGERQMRAG